MKRFQFCSVLSVCALACLVALDGCKTHQEDDSTPLVSLVNAVPATAEVQANAGAGLLLTGSGFNGAVRSFRVPAGLYDVAANVTRNDGRRVPTGPETMRLEIGKRYVVVFSGSDDTLHLKTLVSSLRPIADRSGVKLRIINAAPDTGKIDVSLNAIVPLPSVPFDAQSATVELDAGDYQALVLDAGGAYKPLTTGQILSLHRGGDYTLVVAGRKSDHSITTQLLSE